MQSFTAWLRECMIQESLEAGEGILEKYCCVVLYSYTLL